MGSSPAKKFRKHLIIWISMMLVILVAFLGILRLGVHFSSDILYQLVKRETNGRYQLSFEEIDIDPWNRSIRLKKVRLKPDPNKGPEEGGLSNLYDLDLAGLNIDLKSIISIYTDRQLLMENVRIIDPQIHITKKKNAPNESFSFQTGNLYKEISDYLRVLQIDLLAIQDAQFKHSPSEFGLANIDFMMRNLLIDSASRPDQRFYSENIELEINNQSFMLSDSLHQLHFDRFVLSTADSVLTFDNLILAPVKDRPDDQSDQTIYDLAVPQLTLKGVDYFSAYRYNRLEMEELSITDSHLLLEEQKEPEGDEAAKEGNSLLRELLSIFDQVSIGKMRFINTNLNLKTNNDYNNNYQHIQTERADIVLYNFQLDSSNYQFDFGKKYFDDVDIIIHNYSSYLPDSIHTINFDLLRMSSFDSTLVFENFNISNNDSGSATDMFLSIELPLIRLNGLNYLDILIRRELTIREMHLQNPNIIFEKESGGLRKEDLTPDSLYSLISGHFETIGIKKLLLNQGAFSINKKLKIGRSDLEISDFRLPADTNSWHAVLGGVSLNLQAMDLNGETFNLNAGRITWDSLNSWLIFDELAMDYLDNHLSALGQMTSLSVSGINLDSLYAGNIMSFDSMMMTDPRISIGLMTPDRDQAANPITGSKFIEVVNGQFTAKRYDSTAISLESVNTRLLLGAHSHMYEGNAKNLSITLPNISQRLIINNLRISEQQDLYVQQMRIQRLRDNLKHEVEVTGTIPSLTVHGLDQDMLWQFQKLAGDSLTITNPNVQLNIRPLPLATESPDSIEIEFKKVILDRARIRFRDEGKTPFAMINTPNLSMILEEFKYPQKSALDIDHLLYANNMILDVRNLESRMTNGDSFLVNQLNFNKDEAGILADVLSFDQADGPLTFSMPQLKLVGLDLHGYINEHRLVLDSIEMIAPRITYHKGGTTKTNGKNEIRMPESMAFSWLSSIDTEISFNDGINETIYEMHGGNVEIGKYETKGDLKWEQLFNDAMYASISGEKLVLPLDRGYQLTIDRYALVHPGNTLKLSEVKLTSIYTPEEFSKTLTYQKDWFDASADVVSFSDLDLKRFLNQREFQSRKVVVEALDGLIYRDKNVPFDSTRIKALPQSMLLNIDHWVYIDTLQVMGDITHRIRPENTEEVAEISFRDIDASLMQITTVPNIADRPMRLVATGMLMGEASFQISVMFDMQHPKDRFSFTGQIDQIQLEVLNKLLRPLANINIRDGHGERINFNIKANNEVATGEMRFRYEDLKIQLLNPDSENKKNANQGLKTFVANTFVINDKNPTFLILKPGTIFRERDPSRVIFHYWGEALLSGAVSSIGINKSKKAEKRYEKENEE